MSKTNPYLNMKDIAKRLVSKAEATEKRLINAGHMHIDHTSKSKKLEDGPASVVLMKELSAQFSDEVDHAITALTNLKKRHELNTAWHAAYQHSISLGANSDHLEVLVYTTDAEWLEINKVRLLTLLSQIKLMQLQEQMEEVDPLFGLDSRYSQETIDHIFGIADDWYEIVYLESKQRERKSLSLVDIKGMVDEYERVFDQIAKMKAKPTNKKNSH